MKDERLEKEFGEYFKGVNTPGNITGDAKSFVKPKRKALPKFVKFASCAASLLLVFAVALTVVLKTDLFKAGSAPGDGNTSQGEPSAPDGNGELKYYTDAELSTKTENAYSISSLNSNLKFIENFAIASNASVNLCEAGYSDGKLMLAKAEISLISGLTRDETRIYVEFTDKNLIYGELADYYKGSKSYYRGAEYYLTETTAENGEPNFKLHVAYRGVKYYFDVISPDKKAYQKYLDLIVPL